MKHQRLATVVSLARTLAKSDLTLAAQYLQSQGLPVRLAVHVLARRIERRAA